MVVTVKVEEGVAAAGSDVPPSVSIAFGLPPRTDLASLERELMAIDRIAAIAFPAIGLAVEPGLYELLDKHYLGTADATTVTFGELTGPSEFFTPEQALISDMINGAGTIDMVTADGDPQRVG